MKDVGALRSSRVGETKKAGMPMLMGGVEVYTAKY